MTTYMRTIINGQDAQGSVQSDADAGIGSGIALAPENASSANVARSASDPSAASGDDSAPADALPAWPVARIEYCCATCWEPEPLCKCTHVLPMPGCLYRPTPESMLPGPLLPRTINSIHLDTVIETVIGIAGVLAKALASVFSKNTGGDEA